MKRHGGTSQRGRELTTVVIVAVFGLAALMVLRGYEPLSIIIVVTAIGLIATKVLNRIGHATSPAIEASNTQVGGQLDGEAINSVDW